MFPELHAWMFDSEQIRSPAAARKRAADLAGADRMDQALRSEEVNRQLARGVSVYRVVGAGAIPKLLFGPYVITGVAHDAQALFGLLEGKWGIKPK